MSDLPWVSIVITCFNYERYVGQAIDSALAQSYPNVEIVVVDDGSSDSSARIIDGYADKLKIVRQTNQGSIPAYNSGFAASSGDIVIFLDADDCVRPDLAARVCERWTARCCKVQYDLAIIDEQGNDLKRRFCNFPLNYDNEAVKQEFFKFGTYLWPVTTGNAYSRWFLQFFMPLAISHGPDGFFNTIAPLYGDVVTIAEPLASYRLHGQNMWASTMVRWGERVEKRRQEISNLEIHAARFGIKLPSGNLLDNDLVFINYRLMALKLQQSYSGIEVDTSQELWYAGMRTCWIRAMPLRSKVIHVCWISALALSPSWVATQIINLRFNRAKLFKTLKHQIGRIFVIRHFYEEA